MLNGRVEVKTRNSDWFVDQLGYLVPKLTIGQTEVPEFIIRSLNVKKDNAGSVQRREWGGEILFYTD